MAVLRATRRPWRGCRGAERPWGGRHRVARRAPPFPPADTVDPAAHPVPPPVGRFVIAASASLTPEPEPARSLVPDLD